MSGPFQVGDVVVCVGAHLPLRFAKEVRRAKRLLSQISNGKTYRVDEVRLSRGGVPCLRLAGLDHDIYAGFEAARFRLLPKSDSAFTAQMRALRPIKVEEPANA